MDFFRSFRGAFFHGIFMNFHGAVVLSKRGLSLDFHDAFIGHSWGFRGASMGLFPEVYGLSWSIDGF